MHFLTVLVVVATCRHWPVGTWLREHYPLTRWFGWVSARIVAPLARYTVCVLLPVGLVLLVTSAASGFLAGLVYLLFSIAVLVYCIDMIDLDVTFDDQGIRLRKVDADMTLENLESEQQNFFAATTYDLFQGTMVVLFWFVLLGPAGALLYRLTEDYQDSLDSDEQEMVYLDQLLFWLEWVPVRVAAIIFALLGNFGRALDEVLDSLTNFRDDAMPILSHIVQSSVDIPRSETVDAYLVSVSENLGEMHALLARSLWGWVGFAALLSIFGW